MDALELVLALGWLDVRCALRLEACTRLNLASLAEGLATITELRHGAAACPATVPSSPSGTADAALHATASRHRAALRSLEAIPTAVAVPFADAQVVVGGPIGEKLVGSVQGLVGWGQEPPRQGDHWRLALSLRRGAYWLRLLCGVNAHHGRMQIILDGEILGAVDSFASKTGLMEAWLPVEVHSTGSHLLEGIAMKRNVNSVADWQVLLSVAFAPRNASDASHGPGGDSQLAPFPRSEVLAQMRAAVRATSSTTEGYWRALHWNDALLHAQFAGQPPMAESEVSMDGAFLGASLLHPQPLITVGFHE